VTNGSGNYSLTLKPGKYVVEEVSQAGWTQSSPGNGGTYAVTLTSGQIESGNDFGNYQQATKTGVKFDDLNANGVKDTNDPGLSGWTILAFADNGDGVLSAAELAAGAVATSVTNGSGNYSLTLKPGTYVVEEVSQAGWTQSAPGNGGTYAVTLTSGQIESGNNFGNYQQATKSGIKFDDLDGTGPGTTGPGLSGWTILAFADNGDGMLTANEISAGAVATSVTNGSGNYSLTLKPGKYVVVEESQAGWTQSVPTGTDRVIPSGTGLGDFGYAVTLTSGQIESNNNFGNFQQATKSGVKFNDLNLNGVQDSGEPGLVGWTIYAFADTNGDGILEQNEYTAGAKATSVTNGTGSYSLTLNPGKYIVVEAQQSGWLQSSPTLDVVAATNTNLADGGFAITLTSGQVEKNNNFGNFQPGRGPLTPGFWCNHEWAWNGVLGDEPKNVNSLVGSANSFVLSAKDVLIPVDSNGDGVINANDQKGILIGDANHNGITDPGEVTVFIDLKCAQAIVCASSTNMKDRRDAFLREAIAAQLNIDNGAAAPAGLIKDAAEWLLGYQVDGNGNILSGPGTHTYPDGSSGNVTNQPFGTAWTHGVAQCAVASDGTGIVTVNNGTTGQTTLPAGGTGSNAWNQGGAAIFNALDAFNNDPPAGNSLVVSLNQVATVNDSTDIVNKHTTNTNNAFFQIVS
jgi:hypothetical protein